MKFNRLDDWLTWQESLHSQEIDMGLDRIRQVAQRMGLLTPEAQVVTVAGTNGKGSCVATLEALCLADHRTVGAFTSPHLFEYNERIRVNGRPVSDDDICLAFSRIDEARAEISLTYFEFGALAALDVFARYKVDVCLLEVGLGGRLDAVNIIDADVAVVTSIAIDHEAWLGSDRTVIGREKAGVFRANRPAICADKNAPKSVREVAHEVDALWFCVGQDFDWHDQEQDWFWTSDVGETSAHLLPLPALPQPSVAAALFAYQRLGFELPAALAEIIANVSLPGRTQTIECGGKSLVLDVAHNPAAATHLAQYLRNNPVEGDTFALVALMQDKDRAGVFEPLLSGVDHWSVTSLQDNQRAASAAMLAEDLDVMAVSCREYPDVATALEALLSIMTVADRLVVFGSFFTVADAQRLVDAVESAAD